MLEDEGWISERTRVGKALRAKRANGAERRSQSRGLRVLLLAARLQQGVLGRHSAGRCTHNSLFPGVISMFWSLSKSPGVSQGCESTPFAGNHREQPPKHSSCPGCPCPLSEAIIAGLPPLSSELPTLCGSPSSLGGSHYNPPAPSSLFMVVKLISPPRYLWLPMKLN